MLFEAHFKHAGGLRHQRCAACIASIVALLLRRCVACRHFLAVTAALESTVYKRSRLSAPVIVRHRR
jgi:hypothetical protein